MKFSVVKDDFLKGLSRIQGVVERRNAMPILSHVLVDVSENTLTLTATDLEVGIRTQCPAEVSEPGAIALSAKYLHDIVKELPNYPIHLWSKEQNRVVLTCGKVEFQIVGVSVQDFPKFPDTTAFKFHSIQRDIFQEMITKTAFSISHDEARQHLNGIFMESLTDAASGKRVRMVATDGHRLSLIEKTEEDIHSDLVLKQGVIFPKKGVFELRKIFDEAGSTIQFALHGNEAIFLSDQITLFMRLIDGKYPNYSQVIPTSNKKRVFVNRVTLMDSLKRVSLMANEKSKGVKLSISGQEMIISSVHPELGEAKEEIPVQYDGAPIEIGFNAKYLMDALSVQSVEEICLELEDRLSPGVIKAPQDERHLCVVMPMRLS